jgi:hypothetical protein
MSPRLPPEMKESFSLSCFTYPHPVHQQVLLVLSPKCIIVWLLLPSPLLLPNLKSLLFLTCPLVSVFAILEQLAEVRSHFLSWSKPSKRGWAECLLSSPGPALASAWPHDSLLLPHPLCSTHTVTFLLFLEHTKHEPARAALFLLFPLPETLFPWPEMLLFLRSLLVYLLIAQMPARVSLPQKSHLWSLEGLLYAFNLRSTGITEIQNSWEASVWKPAD